jgi:hypothetical protein
MTGSRPSLLVLTILVGVTLTLGAQTPPTALPGPTRGTQLVSPSSAELRDFTEYLKSHHQTAEDYVIGLFKTHDVVFLGEGCHYCKPNPLFLQRLIPLLYKAGVHTLGYEMSTTEDQAAIDALVTGATYDEDAAFTILQHWEFTWTIQEYADVFRTAWQLNHDLPRNAPRFRIIGIDVKPDWRLLKPGMDPNSAEARGLIVGGDRDAARNQRMATVLRREVLKKGMKALMYNGNGHSQTRYRRPKGGTDQRRAGVGYLIAQEIGDRAFSVTLESPRGPDRGPVVDAVLAGLGPGNQSVGFTAKGSPLGPVMMNVGPDTIKVEDFFDGYIYHTVRTPWEAGTLITRYFTDQRVRLAKETGSLPNLPSVTVDKVNHDAAGIIRTTTRPHLTF